MFISSRRLIDCMYFGKLAVYIAVSAHVNLSHLKIWIRHIHTLSTVYFSINKYQTLIWASKERIYFSIVLLCIKTFEFQLCIQERWTWVFLLPSWFAIFPWPKMTQITAKESGREICLLIKKPDTKWCCEGKASLLSNSTYCIEESHEG